MAKPNVNYIKKEPFRDARLIIVVCEGNVREPAYFRFFDGFSSKVQIVAVESGISSSPKWMVDRALSKEEEIGVSKDIDQVWFAVDTDKWSNQLHELRAACEGKPHWRVAESNPCFEVWLYYHAKANPPALPDHALGQCGTWKPHLHETIIGGFDSSQHPIAIEKAIEHARNHYRATGYSPDPGSTDVWKLGEELLRLIGKDLEAIKSRFSGPKLRD
jgi:hypothetical protein